VPEPPNRIFTDSWLASVELELRKRK